MSMPSEAGNSGGRQVAARLSDGKTAAAKDVAVRLGAHGIEIDVPGGAPITWTYESLTTAEPLTPYAIDVLVGSTEASGATLFIPDAGLARALPTLALQLSARSIRWRHARPWMWAAAGVAAVSFAIWALDLSPARAVAKLLPESARDTLGAEVVRSMTSGKKVCTDAAGRAALDRLATRLADASAKAKFEILVVDWDLMNAFAVPGEQIVLTRGLIAKAGGPDEVAGVLAHEMGHGIEMHPETALVRALGFAAAADLMMGGSGGTLANIGIVLAQLSYSRAAESEADAHALAILKGASVSPHGLGQFFKRVIEMENEKPDYTGIAGIDVFRSHPLTDERQRRVEAQAPYPATPSMTGKDWEALKAICTQADETES